MIKYGLCFLFVAVSTYCIYYYVVDSQFNIAKCIDGYYTVTDSRHGTCSHHGGVEEWIK